MTTIEMKEFYRWLETASDTELIERKSALEVLQDSLREQAVISECSYFIRKIEEELLSRSFK